MEYIRNATTVTVSMEIRIITVKHKGTLSMTDLRPFVTGIDAGGVQISATIPSRQRRMSVLRKIAKLNTGVPGPTQSL